MFGNGDSVFDSSETSETCVKIGLILDLISLVYSCSSFDLLLTYPFFVRGMPRLAATTLSPSLYTSAAISSISISIHELESLSYKLLSSYDSSNSLPTTGKGCDGGLSATFKDMD